MRLIYQTIHKKNCETEIALTDLEIAQMEQEQEITDHDIAIMELQEQINGGGN